MSVRMRSIAVVLSGKRSFQMLPAAADAAAVGREVALSGCNLITGGGEGGMAIVAKAFCQTRGRKGLSVALIPCKADYLGKGPLVDFPSEIVLRPKDGYPNDWVEMVLQTHLPGEPAKGPKSRNIINVASADVVIVLPGGPGTQAELELARALNPPKPTIVWLRDKDQVGSLDANRLPEGVILVADLQEFQSALRAI